MKYIYIYIFISNNTNDFASRENNNKLNSDFLIENKNIIYYHFIKDLFKRDNTFKKIREEFEKLQPIKKLKDFIREIDEINKDFIENNFVEEIVSEIEKIDFLELEEEKIYEEFGDLVEIVTPTDNIECEDVEYDIKVENNILLVYGNIIISNGIDIYTINCARESSEDWYIDNEAWAKLSMDFSFIININENKIEDIEDFELLKENISDFELSNIQIVDIIK